MLETSKQGKILTRSEDTINVFVRETNSRKVTPLSVPRDTTLAQLEALVRQELDLTEAMVQRLVLDGKVLSEKSPLGLRTNATIQVQQTQLLGGMLNNQPSADDEFQRAASAGDDLLQLDVGDMDGEMMESHVNVSEHYNPYEKFADEIFEAEDYPDNAEALKKISSNLKKKFESRNAQLSLPSQEECAAMTDELRTQNWFELLPKDTQELVSNVFSHILHADPELKVMLNDKQALLFDKLKHSRQDMLFLKMRIQKVVRGYANQLKDGDEQKQMLEEKCEKMGLTNAKRNERGHLSHIQHPTTHSLEALDEIHSFHLPADKRNKMGTLRAALPPNAEQDLRPFIHKLDARSSLLLIAAMTPANFRSHLLSDATPGAQKLILELLESATAFDPSVQRLMPSTPTISGALETPSGSRKSISLEGVGIEKSYRGEVFFENLLQAFKLGSLATEDAIFAALNKVFVESTPGERIEMLQSTMSAQLKSKWLNQLLHHEIALLIQEDDQKWSSRVRRYQVLDLLCSQAQYNSVLSHLSEEDQKQIQARKMLLLGGQKQKSLDGLIEDVSKDINFVDSDAQLYRQAIARLDQFVTVEMQRCFYGNSKASQGDSHPRQTSYNVRCEPFLNEEEITARIEEMEELKPKQKRGLKDRVFTKNADTEFVKELTMEERPGEIENKEDKYTISLWGINKETGDVARTNQFKIKAPVEFKDANAFAKGQATSTHKVLLFQGHSKEVFWFNYKDQNEESGLELQVLDADETQPRSYNVPSSSRLYNHIVEGNDVCEDICPLKSFPNPQPTIIRDESGAQIIVFTHFKWADACPSVYFYDPSSEKEIGQAKNALSFLMHAPGQSELEESRLLFEYNPLMAQYSATDADQFNQLIESVKKDVESYYKNGYPIQYSCTVNLAAMRQSRELVHVAQGAQDLNFLETLQNKPQPKVKEICEELEGWILVEGVNIEKYDQELRAGSFQIIPLQSSTSLFSYSKNFAQSNQRKRCENYEVTDIKHIKKLVHDDKLFHQLAFEDETGAKGFYLKIVKASQNAQLIQVDKQDNIRNEFDWPNPEGELKLNKVIQQGAALAHNYLVRSYTTPEGGLTFCSAKLPPKKSQNAPILSCRIISHKSLKSIINFPLMCHQRSGNELVVTHMADADQSRQVFNFEEDKFITFVKLSQADSESRIGFVAKEISTGNPCFILMRNDFSFKKAAPGERNRWSIQKFPLAEPFNKLIEMRDQIVQTQMIEFKNDDLLRNAKEAFPIIEIIMQTKKSIFLVGYHGAEEVLEGLHNELCPIRFICGFNRRYYYVRREIASQTSQLIEVRIERISEIFTISKRVIYESPSGVITGVCLDPSMDVKNDAVWKQSNEKFHLNQKAQATLFVVDEMLNFAKIRQNNNTDEPYVVLYRSNLSHIQGIKESVARPVPFAEMCMSDRCIIVKENAFDLESGSKHNLFEALDKWNVINLTDVRMDGKMVFTLQQKNHRQICFAIMSDVGSRNCSLLGARCNRDIILSEFLAKDLLLLKVLTDRNHEKESYWTMMNTNGCVKDIPATLKRILLSQEWIQTSCRVSGSGRMQLLLKSAEKAVVIELSNKGDLVTESEFILDCSEGEADQDSVLADFDGNIYHVRVTTNEKKKENKAQKQAAKKAGGKKGGGKKGGGKKSKKGKAKEKEEEKELADQKLMIEDEDEKNKGPKEQKVRLTRVHNGNSERIMTKLVFENGEENKKITLCGDYICWSVRQEKSIRVLCLRDFADKKNLDMDQHELKKYLKIVDFAPFLIDVPQWRCTMEATKLNYAVHANPSQRFDEADLRKSQNLLQLTSINRALIFDLDQEDTPVVKEFAAMDMLLESQSFVQPGIKLNNITPRIQGNFKIGILRSIQANLQGGYYILTQSELPQNGVKDRPAYQNMERTSPLLGLYKTYSELDLYAAKELITLVQSGVKPKKIPESLINVTFEGQTLFAIAQDELLLYHAVRDYLMAKEFPEEEDIDRSNVENRNLRRLATLLMLKSYVSVDAECNVQLKSIVIENLEITSKRDTLLKIGRHSPSYSIFSDISDQSQFQKILDFGTQQTIEELEQCFVETKGTSQIVTLNWPRDQGSMTVRSSNCIPTKEFLEKHIENEGAGEDFVIRPVRVTVMSLQWMLEEKENFVGVACMLTDQPNSVYATQFVDKVLDQFWDENQTMIKRRQFWPYLTYLVTALWYFKRALDGDASEHEEIEGWIVFLGVLLMLQWLHQLYHEVVQFRQEENKLDHFKGFWNINDIIGLSLMLIIVWETIFGGRGNMWMSDEQLRIVAAITSCSLMIKLYDWLRLFDETSFYILLLAETMRDIQAFMILMLACLMVFGLPMFFLNLNRTEANSLIDEPFGFWFFNVFLNQYLLALGEFNMDNFAENPQSSMCFFFFLTATFISQLTMLNMLIAIMGDTFGRIMENKDVNATKTKLKILSDNDHTVPKQSKHLDHDVFLFVVSPMDQEGDEDEEWQGAISALNRQSEARVHALKTFLGGQITKLQEQQDEQIKKSAAMDREMKSIISQITRQSTDHQQAQAKESQEIKEMLRELINKKDEEENEERADSLLSGSIGLRGRR